jgi:tRNA 2-thiouridine synthesizing protein A
MSEHQQPLLDTDIRPSVILDAGHESCGMLLILLRQQMRELAPGTVLQVVVYDRGALLDIPAWCWLTSNTFLHSHGDPHGDQPLHFFIRREAGANLGRKLDVYKENEHDETSG